MAKNQLATINEKKRNKLIADFQKVQKELFDSTNLKTWKVATTAYKVKNDPEYSLVFKNDKEFASAVGYSAGAFSKLASVGKMDFYLELNKQYHLTTGQAQELIPIFNLCDDEVYKDFKLAMDTDVALHETPVVIDFINNNDAEHKTTKEIRAQVNDYMLSLQFNPDNNTDDKQGDTNDKQDDADDYADTDSISNVDDTIMSSAEIVDAIVTIIRNYRDETKEECICSWYKDICALLEREGLL